MACASSSLSLTLFFFSFCFFFSSRRRHTRFDCDWSSDVCSSDLASLLGPSAITTVWQGFGGVCEFNDRGDPVVLYDQLADRKSTRLNSSHSQISYAVFCLKKKKKIHRTSNI